MPDALPRFVALDIHKAYVVIGAVDAAQAIVLPPRRIALAQFLERVLERGRWNLAEQKEQDRRTFFASFVLYDLVSKRITGGAERLPCNRQGEVS